METTDQQQPQEIIPEVVQPVTAVEKIKPFIPVSIEELSQQEDRGLAVIKTKDAILTSLYRASLKKLMPSDCVLFRDNDGNVTAYVQDRGCDRIAPLWGIDITPEGDYERIDGEDGIFGYRIRGSAYSRVTGESVLDMEGVRWSNEDFVKYDKGGILEIKVKKAARANLDGGCVRELAGMKSIPEQELADAWKDTWKKTVMCPKGKGFGSKAERQGAQVQQGDKTDDPGPKCPKCSSKMFFNKAGTKKNGDLYPAFWGCSKWKEGCKGAVQDSEYQQSKRFGEGSDPDPLIGREPGMEG